MERNEFRGINGCLQWATKELLYLFQFVVKVLQRRQGQARVRDLNKANEVIDEIKQHEDFTLTYRVLDLTSCGLIGVSDASLGNVDRFGHPSDQDSKTVKVHSQAGLEIFIGEESLASLGARGKFNVLECDSLAVTRVCRSSMAAETRGLGLQVDSMQFCGDLLTCVRVRKSCTTSLVLWRMHGKSCFSKCLVPSIFYCDSERCVFLIRFVKNLEFRSVDCWVKFFSFFRSTSCRSVIVSHVLMVARFFWFSYTTHDFFTM